MRLVSDTNFIPPDRQSIADAILKNGQSIYEAKAFGRLFGFDNVATTRDLKLSDAFKKVLCDIEFQNAKPEAIIYCHGNPVQYRGEDCPILDAITDHPSLNKVNAIYELDQQTCSTMFWALDLAEGLLRDGLSSVVILAGDSVENMPLTERHALGVTAVGDAFVGLLLDGAKTGIQVEQIFVDMRCEFHQGRTASSEQTAAFNANHTALVQAILDRVTPSHNRPSAILPHNVNRLIWQKFSKESGISFDDIWLDLLPNVGHCYTVDAATHLGRFKTSDKLDATLLSVGQGGFLGGCKMRKEAEVCRL